MGKREVILLAGTTFLALAAVGTIFGLKNFSGTRSEASLEGKNVPENIKLEVLPTEATITWTTGKAAYGFVSYGKTMSLGITAQTDSASTVQSVALAGLESETTYYYKVGVGDSIYGSNGTEEDTDIPYSFTTPKADSVAADDGTGVAKEGDPESTTVTITETELIAAMGTTNATYDLNGDGKVNSIDLTIFRDSQ